MSTLGEAIRIAAEAHGNTLDREGQPYILHPIRVMMQQTSETARIVAVLHDVVEDTDVTFDDLRSAGFSEEVLEPLQLITHDDDSSYEDYLQRLSHHPIARKVKIADLKDNINPLRLDKITDYDVERMRKYHRALEMLHGLE